VSYYPSTLFVRQFFNDAGVPLSGGTITAIVADTASTATPMYIDNIGTSAGSVITLNARGEPQVSGNTVIIWLDTTVIYKFILKDAYGTSKWTVDDLAGPLGLLGSSTNAAWGDALVAVKRTFTGAIATTQHAMNEGLWVTPEEAGGVADGGSGNTDNAVALQAALNSGRLVYLDPGKVYAFGSQLTIPSYGGFIGGGRLLMLTGTGKFDVATYGNSFATNSCGVYALSKSNITIKCQIQMQANAGVRTCNALAVRDCSDANIDVIALGFAQAEIPIINIDSITRGFIRAIVRDCTTNDNTLATCNVAAIGVVG